MRRDYTCRTVQFDQANTLPPTVGGTGYRARLRFNLTQHMRDELLVAEFMNVFGCGSYYLNDATYSYNVYGNRENMSHIVPYYLKYPVLGAKAAQFRT